MMIRVVSHRQPPSTGGVERHVGKMSRALVNRGHSVELFSSEGRLRAASLGDLAPSSVFDGRYGGDVLHCHNIHAFPGVLAALTVPDDTRLVITPHYHGERSPGTSRVGYRLLMHLAGHALRKADSVVAVSEYEAELLRQDFNVEPVIVPHGLDHDWLSYRPGHGSWEFGLIVGSLTERKQACAAVDILQDAGLDAVVVGDGPLRDRLRRRDNVFVFTDADDADLAKLYRDAAVLVNASKHEAFGMTIGEALASGTPCVIEPSGGLSRWLGTKGVHEIGPGAVERAIKSTVDDRPLWSWADAATALEGAAYK